MLRRLQHEHHRRTVHKKVRRCGRRKLSLLVQQLVQGVSVTVSVTGRCSILLTVKSYQTAVSAIAFRTLRYVSCKYLLSIPLSWLMEFCTRLRSGYAASLICSTILSDFPYYASIGVKVNCLPERLHSQYSTRDSATQPGCRTIISTQHGNFRGADMYESQQSVE